jgi:dihydrolipoamide dehydrogenase
MKHTYDYDVIVIGGGSAGIAAAERAISTGASVCLLEEGMLGGECSFSACTPTKTLLYAARLYFTMQKDAPHFGVVAKQLRYDFMRIHKRKDALLEALYKHGAHEHL